GRWSLAARRGLADPVLAAAAADVFDLACRHLGDVGASPAVRALVEEITERRVRYGRCPADERTPGGRS
ncbi:MAG: hypothetical protein M3R63_17985, partial [Actinomycetota bacterium]|nr:hypothetical protein [Actinomycetota bacterium]